MKVRFALYTRGGDKGETGLFGEKRVPKDSSRVEAYGALDELSSSIGVAIADSSHPEITSKLKDVQKALFVAGADLAADYAGHRASRVPRMTAEHTKWLENETDGLQKELPRLVNFILPGGSKLSADLHLARAVCRRAERRIVSASRSETVNPEILPFINRLSTYLFNLARYANLKESRSDEVWNG